MIIVWVKNDDFLNYTDFEGEWDNLHSIEVWCEEIEIDKRPPRKFEGFEVWKGYDCYVRILGDPQWIKIEKIRIIYNKEK